MLKIKIICDIFVASQNPKIIKKENKMIAEKRELGMDLDLPELCQMSLFL